ncbi:MAG: hypothetical protein R2716_06930 [Microthrixaceae bacterium]
MIINDVFPRLVRMDAEDPGVEGAAGSCRSAGIEGAALDQPEDITSTRCCGSAPRRPAT